MRRIFPMLLAFLLLLSLWGCKDTSAPELTMPVAYYYHNDLDKKDDFDNVYVSEMREGAHYQNDLIGLLNNYLSGPESETLVNPFPSGLKVVSCTMTADTAQIVLTDQITKLNTIDLTMAYTCLSLTVFSYTACNYVELSAQNALIADQKSILIPRDSLLLSDNTPLSTEN